LLYLITGYSGRRKAARAHYSVVRESDAQESVGFTFTGILKGS